MLQHARRSRLMHRDREPACVHVPPDLGRDTRFHSPAARCRRGGRYDQPETHAQAPFSFAMRRADEPFPSASTFDVCSFVVPNIHWLSRVGSTQVRYSKTIPDPDRVLIEIGKVRSMNLEVERRVRPFGPAYHALGMATAAIYGLAAFMTG